MRFRSLGIVGPGTRRPVSRRGWMRAGKLIAGSLGRPVELAMLAPAVLLMAATLAPGNRTDAILAAALVLVTPMGLGIAVVSLFSIAVRHAAPSWDVTRITAVTAGAGLGIAALLRLGGAGDARLVGTVVLVVAAIGWLTVRAFGERGVDRTNTPGSHRAIVTPNLAILAGLGLAAAVGLALRAGVALNTFRPSAPESAVIEDALSAGLGAGPIDPFAGVVALVSAIVSVDPAAIAWAGPIVVLPAILATAAGTSTLFSRDTRMTIAVAVTVTAVAVVGRIFGAPALTEAVVVGLLVPAAMLAAFRAGGVADLAGIAVMSLAALAIDPQTGLGVPAAALVALIAASGVRSGRRAPTGGGSGVLRASASEWIAGARVAFGHADAVLVLPLVLLGAIALMGSPRADAAASTGLAFALPTAAGTAVLSLGVLARSGRRLALRAETLAVGFALGHLVILAAALLSSAAGIFSVGGLAIVLMIGSVVAWAAIVLITNRSGAIAAEIIRVNRDRLLDLGMLGVAAVGGLAMAAWYRMDSPPPFHPGWDSLAHLRIIDGLLAGDFRLLPSQYSATFRVDAYVPIQQLEVALSSTLSGQHPLAVYWGGQFVVMPLTAIMATILARAVGASRLVAMVAGGAVIIGGFPFQQLSFLGLLPAGLAALGFPVMAMVAIRDVGGLSRRVATVVVVAIGAMAIHLLIGAGVALFGGGGLVLREVLRRQPRLGPPMGVAVLAIGAVLLAGYAGIRHLPSDQLGELDPSEREFVRITSLAARQRDIEARISAIILLGSGIGVAAMALHPDRRKRNAVPAGLWAATVVSIFAPIAGADRAIAAMPAILPAGIAAIGEFFRRLALAPGPMVAERGVAVGLSIAGLAGIAFLPAFAFLQYQQRQSGSAPFLTSFLPDERLAALAIRETTPAETVIVSDPVTQEILGGIGARETYGGGPYANDLQLDALKAALRMNDPASQWEALRNAEADWSQTDEPVLVAVTGRTAMWLARTDRAWVGWPGQLDRYLVDEEGEMRLILRNLSDPHYYQIIWWTRDVRLVALRPARDAAIPDLVDVPIVYDLGPTPASPDDRDVTP